MYRIITIILVLTLICFCSCTRTNRKTIRQGILLEGTRAVSSSIEIESSGNSLAFVLDSVVEEKPKANSSQRSQSMDILDSSGAMVTKMSCSLIDDIFKNNRKTPEESQRFQKSQRMKKDKQEITTSPNDSSVKIQSWTLEKREAVNLQLPNLVEGASGTVVVIIKVDRQGEVVFAEVDPTVSSINVELKENARKAAKKSKFSVSSDSPIRQTGVIVYYYH